MGGGVREEGEGETKSEAEEACEGMELRDWMVKQEGTAGGGGKRQRAGCRESKMREVVRGR